MLDFLQDQHIGVLYLFQFSGWKNKLKKKKKERLKPNYSAYSNNEGRTIYKSISVWKRESSNALASFLL